MNKTIRINSVYLMLPFIMAASIAMLFLTPNPFLALIIPAAVAVFFVMLRYPEIPVYFIIFLTPFNAWQSLSSDMHFLSLSKIFGIAAILSIIFRISFNPSSIIKLSSPVWKIIFFFLVVMVISTVFSPFRVYCFLHLRLFIQALLFLAAIVFLGCNARFIRNSVLALVAGNTASSIIAIYGSVFNIKSIVKNAGQQGFEAMRAIGAETDPNILAAALVCSIPFCVHFLFSSQTVHHKTIAFLCAGLNICAVLLTYSRAIIIVMFVTIIILLISNLNKLSIRHAGFYLAGAFVALFLIVKFIPDSQLMKRLSSLSSFSTNTSLSRRSSYIRAGLDALAKRPLIGYGPGAFPQIYSATTSAAAYATRREAFFREAHNTYLQTAVETGITGGVLFAVIAATGLIYLFKSVKQLPKTGIITEGLAKATLISMVSFFISIMFLTIPHHKYIWLHIGLAVSFYRFAKQPGMIICEKRLSI